MEIESVGGSIDSYGGNNSFGVNAEVLSGDFATGLDLLADVLLDPGFPGRRAGARAGGPVGRYPRAEGPPSQERHARPCAAPFSGAAGYGLDALGTEESLPKLDAATVQAFHRRFATPDNGVLAIFGDVNAGQVKAAVESVFAGWKPSRDRPWRFQISNSNFQIHPCA